MDTEINLEVHSYLSFKIAEEEFAASVNEVVNILELQKITKIPKAPNYLKGIIDLRGKVLPVIDTRIKLNLPPTEYTDDTCIIVMDLNINNEIIHIGALVDSVLAVREIDESQISNTPDIGNAYKSEFISGVAKIGEHFVMILDLVKLFSADEINEFKESNNKITIN